VWSTHTPNLILIASAPDLLRQRDELLAALQATLNQLDTVCAAIVWPAFGLPDARTTDSYKLARAAIASAEQAQPTCEDLNCPCTAIAERGDK
jgi:hypothetical protein